MERENKINPSRSFSFFRWDIYFKPEYSTSLLLDHKGRARMSGYDSTSSKNSSRLSDIGRYDKLYKGLQRVFVRNEKNYCKRADEILVYALPSKNNPNKDVCIIKFTNGEWVAHPKAYMFFDSMINYREVEDNDRLNNQIINYLNHFVKTGENKEPSLRPVVKKTSDPFTPKIFSNKADLQAYCTRLTDAGFALGLCQSYYEKMIIKNNL